MTRSLRWLLPALLFALFVGLPGLAGFYTDWLWFGETGFRDVFASHFHVTTSGFFSNPALLCCIMELGIDRILGGVFGLVRALVLMLAVATVVSFTPAVRASSWQASHGAAWLGALLSGLKPVLPPAVARHLT